MLETIAILLIILWLLGLVSGYTLGNFIYILLVIAIVLILVRLVSGRTFDGAYDRGAGQQPAFRFSGGLTTADVRLSSDRLKAGTQVVVQRPGRTLRQTVRPLTSLTRISTIAITRRM